LRGDRSEGEMPGKSIYSFGVSLHLDEPVQNSESNRISCAYVLVVGC
jgi:hypothetical protein